MVPPIRLSDAQLSDLRAVLFTDADAVNAFNAQLQNEPASFLTPSELRAILRRWYSRDVSRRIVKVCLYWANFCRQNNLTDKKTFSNWLKGSVEDKLNKAELKDWGKNFDVFWEVIASSLVSLSAKAVDVQFDFEKIFGGGRILTDLRPVFNIDRERVASMILTFSLRVDYAESGGRSSIALALDLQDIEQLRIACEEALTKAKALEKALDDGVQTPHFKIGEQGYDAVD